MREYKTSSTSAQPICFTSGVSVGSIRQLLLSVNVFEISRSNSAGVQKLPGYRNPAVNYKLGVVQKARYLNHLNLAVLSKISAPFSSVAWRAKQWDEDCPNSVPTAEKNPCRKLLLATGVRGGGQKSLRIQASRRKPPLPCGQQLRWHPAPALLCFGVCCKVQEERNGGRRTKWLFYGTERVWLFSIWTVRALELLHAEPSRWKESCLPRVKLSWTWINEDHVAQGGTMRLAVLQIIRSKFRRHSLHCSQVDHKAWQNRAPTIETGPYQAPTAHLGTKWSSDFSWVI